jgi:hypothetical protein
VNKLPDRPRGPVAPRSSAGRPAAARHRPADISRELVTLLRTHGLSRIYWSACALRAVISVSPALTVWTDGRYLTCHYQGTRSTWPVTSTEQAARELAQLARQQAASRTNGPEGTGLAEA